MEKPKWFIESFDKDNSFEELSNEVLRQGMDCIVLKYDPSGNEVGTSLKNVYPYDQCVVFQGSMQMAEKIQAEKNWNPGAIATWNNFLCQTYYCHYGKWLLNGDYVMLPFKEFLRRENKFTKDYTWGSFFIRPNGGTKSFTGCVWDLLSDNMKQLMKTETPPEELVLVSVSKWIHREWRLICTKDRVLTGSRYKTWGRPDYNPEVPPEAIALAEEILKESQWVPDPIFAMDICQDAHHLYKLLEIGAFSMAALYKCDMKPIVEAVTEIALKQCYQPSQDV